MARKKLSLIDHPKADAPVSGQSSDAPAPSNIFLEAFKAKGGTVTRFAEGERSMDVREIDRLKHGEPEPIPLNEDLDGIDETIDDEPEEEPDNRPPPLPDEIKATAYHADAWGDEGGSLPPGCYWLVPGAVYRKRA